jgi:hypothetical protein
MLFCLPSSLFAQNQSSAPPKDGLIDFLQGFELTESGINLNVWSCGCTTKKDFYFTRDTTGGRFNKITVYRMKGDTCKEKPFALKLSFTFEEVGFLPNQSVKVVNPFLPSKVLKISRDTK